MPAYRFCRTDDIPFLTHALNACYVVHLRDHEPLSVDDFKREIRELNVWASNCMTVTEAGEPIAVLTGAKREHETLIHRIGVRAEFQRQGHARHMIESLCHKLSVLGPPRVVAELPDDAPGVQRLFEEVGFVAAGALADFEGTPAPTDAGSSREIIEIDLDDLLREGVFDTAVSRGWERDLETLRGRKEEMKGLALRDGSRVGAYALFRPLEAGCGREIVALAGAKRDPGAQANTGGDLAGLLQAVCGEGRERVTIPRISTHEMAWDDLGALGFRRTQTYTVYVDVPGSRMH
jgi:GNAT superfamily N-acetyltransferase